MAILLCCFKVTLILSRAMRVSKCTVGSLSHTHIRTHMHTHTPHRHTGKPLKTHHTQKAFTLYLLLPTDRGSHAAKAATTWNMKEWGRNSSIKTAWGRKGGMLVSESLPGKARKLFLLPWSFWANNPAQDLLTSCFCWAWTGPPQEQKTSPLPGPEMASARGHPAKVGTEQNKQALTNRTSPATLLKLQLQVDSGHLWRRDSQEVVISIWNIHFLNFLH